MFQNGPLLNNTYSLGYALKYFEGRNIPKQKHKIRICAGLKGGGQRHVSEEWHRVWCQRSACKCDCETGTARLWLSLCGQGIPDSSYAEEK